MPCSSAMMTHLVNDGCASIFDSVSRQLGDVGVTSELPGYCVFNLDSSSTFQFDRGVSETTQDVIRELMLVTVDMLFVYTHLMLSIRSVLVVDLISILLVQFNGILLS